MISLWDVLKASKGLPVSDLYAAMWGKQIAGKYTITELEGTLPMSIVSAGKPLMDYRIYGNTEQTGTPTPGNPIMPIGCGELETTGAHAGQYKLPILSNSTVTNIYLGEAETTRRIKKLVLTGEEDWFYRQGEPPNVFFTETSGINVVDNCALCTHYSNQDSGSFEVLENKHLLVRKSSVSTKWFIGIRDSTFPSGGPSVAILKSYLAAQYSAGTPVTIWYVLAEPKTAVVNEPLMKIGNYADTLSMEQAGVSIPTNKGTTVIDCEDSPKPEKMYIKYLEVKND